MQTKSQILVNFLVKLFSNFEKVRKRSLSKTFYKLQIAIINRDINEGKISNQPIQNYSSINRVNSYASIKPSQEYYTTVKGDAHNYQAETIDINQNFSHFDSKFTKENYFQKYLNQTVKQYHRIWYFPVSELIGKSIGNYNPQALDTILKSDYKQFFESLLVKRKSWGKMQTPSHRLQYKKSMQKPLTAIKEEYHDDAMEIFSMLFHMQAVDYEKPKHHYIAIIVNRTIMMEDEFKDEIFLQVIKQMSSTQKHNDYLPLFIVMCTVIKVSLRMYVPLLNYLIYKSKKSIHAYSYLFYAVIRNFDRPRKGPVTSIEAYHIMKLRQVGITVCFPAEKTFYFDYQIDVSQVIKQIVKFYQLDENIKYLLFYEGRYFEQGKMLDCFSNAVKHRDMLVDYQNFQGYRVLITFKNMVEATQNKTNNDLLYCYCATQYLNSMFKLTRDQIIQISALKYYSENDSIDMCEITKYVPKQYYLSHPDSNIERLMVKSIEGITCTKYEARNKILQIFKNQDAFMSLIFEAEMFFEEQDAECVQINLYLKPGKLILVGRGDYSCYRHIKLNQVKKWGRSKKKLCLVIDKFGKVYFESESTDLLAQIFQMYISTLEKYKDNK